MVRLSGGCGKTVWEMCEGCVEGMRRLSEGCEEAVWRVW